MDRRTGQEYGFTLIELVVTITIFAVIIGVSIAGFRNYAYFQQHDEAVSNIEFTLNQTRLDARSAVADASHGVKFTSNSVTQFEGDTYVASDPSNVVTTYNQITIQPNLTGGTDTVVFKKLTGLPSATGTVTIAGTAFSASTTLKISPTGGIE